MLYVNSANAITRNSGKFVGLEMNPSDLRSSTVPLDHAKALINYEGKEKKRLFSSKPKPGITLIFFIMFYYGEGGLLLFFFRAGDIGTRGSNKLDWNKIN